MTPEAKGLLAALAAGLCTSLGGSTVFVVKTFQRLPLAICMATSAGVMTYVSFVEIFPESNEGIRKGLRSRWSVDTAAPPTSVPISHVSSSETKNPTAGNFWSDNLDPLAYLFATLCFFFGWIFASYIDELLDYSLKRFGLVVVSGNSSSNPRESITPSTTAVESREITDGNICDLDNRNHNNNKNNNNKINSKHNHLPDGTYRNRDDTPGREAEASLLTASQILTSPSSDAQRTLAPASVPIKIHSSISRSSDSRSVKGIEERNSREDQTELTGWRRRNDSGSSSRGAISMSTPTPPDQTIPFPHFQRDQTSDPTSHTAPYMGAKDSRMKDLTKTDKLPDQTADQRTSIPSVPSLIGRRHVGSSPPRLSVTCPLISSSGSSSSGNVSLGPLLSLSYEASVNSSGVTTSQTTDLHNKQQNQCSHDTSNINNISNDPHYELAVINTTSINSVTSSPVLRRSAVSDDTSVTCQHDLYSPSRRGAKVGIISISGKNRKDDILMGNDAAALLDYPDDQIEDDDEDIKERRGRVGMGLSAAAKCLGRACRLICPSFETGGSANDFEIAHAEECFRHDYDKIYRMGLFTAIALSLHNLPEGVATFSGALSSDRLGFSVATAIGIHNIPEGFAVSVPLYFGTGRKWSAFMYSVVTGLAEPLGAFIAWGMLSSGEHDDLTLGILFGIVAGIMTNIALKELLPSAIKYDPLNQITSISFAGGMAVMAASLALFGFTSA